MPCFSPDDAQIHLTWEPSCPLAECTRQMVWHAVLHKTPFGSVWALDLVAPSGCHLIRAWSLLIHLLLITDATFHPEPKQSSRVPFSAECSIICFEVFVEWVTKLMPSSLWASFEKKDERWRSMWIVLTHDAARSVFISAFIHTRCSKQGYGKGIKLLSLYRGWEMVNPKTEMKKIAKDGNEHTPIHPPGRVHLGLRSHAKHLKLISYSDRLTRNPLPRNCSKWTLMCDPYMMMACLFHGRVCKLWIILIKGLYHIRGSIKPPPPPPPEERLSRIPAGI